MVTMPRENLPEVQILGHCPTDPSVRIGRVMGTYILLEDRENDMVHASTLGFIEANELIFFWKNYFEKS